MLRSIGCILYHDYWPTNLISYRRNNSESRVNFVATHEQLEKVLQIRQQTKIEKIVLMEDSEHSEAIPFRSLIVNAPPGRDAALDAIGEAHKPDSLATIIYTSRTTGTPKGAILTPENIASNIVICLVELES